MHENKKDYYEMIEALQKYELYKPVVNKIRPYVSLLEFNIRNIIEIFCNSCAEDIKSKCKNLDGCYCLKQAKELIDV